MTHLRFSDQVKWKLQQILLKKLLELRSNASTEYFVQYHLPRTAGTAIKHAIRQQGYANRILTLSHGASLRATSFRYPNLTSFGVIRHPLTWYMSMYNIKINSQLTGAKARIKNYPAMPNNSLNDFYNDLVLYKEGPPGIRKWNKPWTKGRVGYESAKHYYPQYGYLTNLLIYYYFKSPLPLTTTNITPEIAQQNIGVDHVLHFENISAELNQLLSTANLNLDLEPKVKASRPIQGSNPQDYFSPSMIEQIKQRDRLIYQLYYPEDL